MNNNVFIIGCKGIPARYGGFETFTDNLISRSEDNLVKYYVACMSNDKKKQNVFNYHGATCKYIFVPDIGAAKAILYDVRSLNWAIRTIDTKGITGGYVYILGCTIGPLINLFKNKLKKRGFKIYLNPDGHEWKRDKWSYPVKQYLKLSESSMIKASDLTICDSVSIKNYVDDTYKRFHPNTRYISYGSDIIDSNLNSDSTKVKNYFSKHSIKENEYYLVVGRFVPENNYETIIREFMLSKTKRNLVIITNFNGSKFFDELKEKTKFENDKRIKFVGTVYDSELLKYIRENAFAYIHGHSVGGTNPSLLEALGLTKLCLLFNIGFNSEVAGDAALYWDKERGSLSSLINKADKFSTFEREQYFEKGKKIIKERYTWELVVSEYNNLFLN